MIGFHFARRKPGLRNVWIVTLAALLGGCGATSTTEVGYLQDVAHDDARVGLGFFSHAEPGARRDYIHCDNFSLTRPLELTNVRWWGYMDGTAGADLFNVSGFVVEVHADHDSASPTDILYHKEYTLAETSPVATGRRGSGVGEASTALEYRHEVAIDPPVQLKPGVVYHLLVAARLKDPSRDNWQWADAEDADKITMIYSYKRQSWQRFEDTDSAFELLGRRR